MTSAQVWREVSQVFLRAGGCFFLNAPWVLADWASAVRDRISRVSLKSLESL